MTNRIVVLKGDYIGPEIMAAGLKVLRAAAEHFDFDYDLIEEPFGGEAIDKVGEPLPQTTVEAAKNADAVLLSAIGGPKWDNAPKRPEAGLLSIRKQMGLYANIRPTRVTKQLKQYSPIENEIASGTDFVIVRELTSGIYFGEPRWQKADSAIDTTVYRRNEVQRIARTAFDMAMKRRKHVTVVDKANVLATSKFWRQIVGEIQPEYPDVTVDYMYVDATAMNIVSHPKHFDVILTDNMFGDILSDQAAAITGSLGMIPSMSVGQSGPNLYEPIHGLAPDIAGKHIANPISMINSISMMLRYTFDQFKMADVIDRAVSQTIEDHFITRDLGGDETTEATTKHIIKSINRQEAPRYVKDNV